MRALVIINGYPNGEKFYRQGERIAVALQELGVETDVLKNGEVYAKIDNDGKISSSFGEKYAFAVFLDKDKYLGRMLESCGIRLFNRAEAVEICDDKLLTFLALAQGGVRLIKSMPAPLCYTPSAKPSEYFLSEVAKNFSFPLVAKKSYGSFGAGVRLVSGMEELRKTEEEWLHVPHFYQAYVSASCGRDIRVIVVGGKSLGGMERRAQEGEFRSNIELGGIGAKIELPKAERELAEKVATLLGLDYCGVDVLQTEDGPVLCEVNSNAFFEGFESALGIDVAKEYALHILKTVKESK